MKSSVSLRDVHHEPAGPSGYYCVGTRDTTAFSWKQNFVLGFSYYLANRVLEQFSCVALLYVLRPSKSFVGVEVGHGSVSEMLPRATRAHNLVVPTSIAPNDCIDCSRLGKLYPPGAE